MDRVIANEHNWGWNVDSKGNHFRLGNWTDAGWHWDGDDDQAMGFMIRMAQSSITDELLEKVKEEKISWNKFKTVLKKAVAKNDGLYELSGDNSVWHFGHGYEPDYYSEQQYLEENGYTKEEAEKEVDAKASNASTSYEEFEKEWAETYKKEMNALLKQSKSFKEFIDELNSEGLRMDWVDREADYEKDAFYNAEGDPEVEAAVKSRMSHAKQLQTINHPKEQKKLRL